MMKNICPDEEMLADYFESRLSDESRAEMDAHLSDCERCMQEFMIGKGLVREGGRVNLDDVPSEVTEAAVRMVSRYQAPSFGSLKIRLKRFVLGLYSRLSHLFGLTPWGDWQLSPIRGSKRVIAEDLVNINKIFKEIETEIEIEKTARGKACIRVKLMEGSQYKEGVRVTLSRAERELFSHLLGGGYVLFEDVTFGHYNLTFSKDGVIMGKYFFEIKDSN